MRATSVPTRIARTRFPAQSGLRCYRVPDLGLWAYLITLARRCCLMCTVWLGPLGPQPAHLSRATRQAYTRHLGPYTDRPLSVPYCPVLLRPLGLFDHAHTRLAHDSRARHAVYLHRARVPFLAVDAAPDVLGVEADRSRRQPLHVVRVE